MPTRPASRTEKFWEADTPWHEGPASACFLPAYRGSGKLHGKATLITGGDSGIGRAVVTLFAREGADVAIVYLPQEKDDAAYTRKAIEREGRKCELIPGDVTDRKFCDRAVRETVGAFGRLDVLVNNAAYEQMQDDPRAISDEQLDRTFRTNIFGYFYMVRAALAHLKSGAAIINTGSICGLEGHGSLIDYAATKGAIHALTKSLAKNLRCLGIRVNCVAPGPVWTDLNPKGDGDGGNKNPLERSAKPEEIAPAFVFLASPIDSPFITGELLTLTGGNVHAG